MRESRGYRPVLPVRNKPGGFSGRKATLKQTNPTNTSIRKPNCLGVSKHGAQRPQKPQGLVGTRRMGGRGYGGGGRGWLYT